MTFRIILERQREDINATLGRLELPGPVYKFFATLEPLPPVIPPGIYPLKYEYSAKFKRHLWELKDVPGHSELKIHNGNTRYAADPDGFVYEQTEGCVEIGMKHGHLMVSAKGRNGLPSIHGLQPAVLSSRFALQMFHSAMSGFNQAQIEIIDLIGADD